MSDQSDVNTLDNFYLSCFVLIEDEMTSEEKIINIT